jgi:hypothetical protein
LTDHKIQLQYTSIVYNNNNNNNTIINCSINYINNIKDKNNNKKYTRNTKNYIHIVTKRFQGSKVKQIHFCFVR